MTALVVTAAIAPLLAEPRAASEQRSQALAGHDLTVLEARDAWYRVSGEDGYEGWVHAGYVQAMPPRERAKRYGTRRLSLGCGVRELDGRRRTLPLGAVLADDAFIESGMALAPRDVTARFPRTPLGIARSALTFFEGTPYQWGGITPWGADCSGFVQTIFNLHGVRLPRDAHQQATLGAPVEGGPRGLHAADLLFFSERPDGHITHVALALGDDRLAHVGIGRGGYRIERLTERDSYADALVTRFRFARRMEV